MQTWTTTTELLPHQIPAVEKLLATRVGGLYLDMGLGKTRCAIELIARRQKRIDRVIYVTPVALKHTTVAEWRKHTTIAPERIAVFGDRTRAGALPAADVYVVGLESVSSSSRVVVALRDLITTRSCVIVDESTYIKGHRALRTARLTLLARPARYRLILTGTPLTQGVEDLFAQMTFLDEKILGYRSFYSFAANHLEYSKDIPGKIVRAHNVGLLAAKIGPYVYQVTKADALTLPSKRRDARYCDLTRAQYDAYQQAKDRFYADALTVDDPHQAVYLLFRLFTFLQQIACGFWTRAPNGPETYPHERLALFDAIIAALPSETRVVVWAKYLRCIDDILTHLHAAYGADQVVCWDGRRDERERAAELARWRQGARFFVATPSTGGHGLTLTEATVAVFYTNGWKYSERIQAEDRMHRIGQERPVQYIDIIAERSIDERIAKALDRKEGVLDAFRRRLDAVKGEGKAAIRAMLKTLIEEL